MMVDTPDIAAAEAHPRGVEAVCGTCSRIVRLSRAEFRRIANPMAPGDPLTLFASRMRCEGCGAKATTLRLAAAFPD